MPDMSLSDEIQRAIADLVVGDADPQRQAVLQLPQAVAPLLRALEPSTADAIVPQLARVAARVLADPQHPGAPPHDALMAVSHALSTLVAMACGALPLSQESLVTAFRTLGDTGITILERRLLEAPPDQARRIQTLLVDLRRPSTPQEPLAPAPLPVGDDDAEPQQATPAEPALPVSPTDEPVASATPSVEPMEQQPEPEPEPQAQPTAARTQPVGPTETAGLPDGPLAGDAEPEPEPALADQPAPLLALPAYPAAKPAADGIDDLIRTLTGDPDAAARRNATQALAQRGPAAVAAIHQRLDAEIRAAYHDPAVAEPRAGTRVDLVLAAARIDDPAALDPLLQALLDDPTPAVRRAAAGAIRVRAVRQPEAVRPLLDDALDAAISPELAELVVDLLPNLASQLLADLGSADDRIQGRAIAVLVALARHDPGLADRITQALTQPNLRARAAAAEIIQRLGAIPSEPDLAVAYHLALGHDLAVAYHLATSRLEAIRPLGQPALPALRAACSLYDWRTAGPVAILMLKLGLDPADPLLDQIETALDAAAAVPDGALVRTVGPPSKPSATSRGREQRLALQFTIPRDDDRQAARELLFRLRRMRERLLQALADDEAHRATARPKRRPPNSDAQPKAGTFTRGA